MKKILSTVFILAQAFVASQAQLENGEPILRVYSNFYKGLTKADAGAAFEVRRVYLGYQGNINNHFTASVKLDIGSPEDLSQYSLIRRYAYFKTAELKYRKDKLIIHVGLFDMLQFDLQEDRWGYRYLYKSFMDEYKFGPSADIGIGAEYFFNDKLHADLVISNGEGYKNLQSDNSFKTGAGLTFTPYKGLNFRMYYDFIQKDIFQSTLVLFISYDVEKYRISFEFIKNWNNDFFPGHDLSGVSVYGTYVLNESWEIFGRYDRLVSNLDIISEIPWNLNSDGSAIISGIQYKVHKNILLALNYRDWYSYAQNGPDRSYVFVNLEFKL